MPTRKALKRRRRVLMRKSREKRDLSFARRTCRKYLPRRQRCALPLSLMFARNSRFRGDIRQVEGTRTDSYTPLERLIRHSCRELDDTQTRAIDHHVEIWMHVFTVVLSSCEFLSTIDHATCTPRLNAIRRKDFRIVHLHQRVCTYIRVRKESVTVYIY